jgi:hypothetical protein
MLQEKYIERSYLYILCTNPYSEMNIHPHHPFLEKAKDQMNSLNRLTNDRLPLDRLPLDRLPLDRLNKHHKLYDCRLNHERNQIQKKFCYAYYFESWVSWAKPKVITRKAHGLLKFLRANLFFSSLSQERIMRCEKCK